MKNLFKLFVLLIAILMVLSVNAYTQIVIPVENELVLPKHAIAGFNSAARLMYVCRLKLTGLNPNATYRYATGASTNANITSGTAPGNWFGINNTSNAAGYIQGYSSSKSLTGSLLSGDEWTTLGRYSEFTTDSNGNYIGWFALVPTSNAVFRGGNEVYIYVQTNDGAGGTTWTNFFRTTSTVNMRNYGTISGGDTMATAIYGNSDAANETFVFLYDNTSGTGRPIYGTWTENDGIDEASNWTVWYQANVGSTKGNWGAVIPNNLANGVRRIESRDISNNILYYSTDDDGVWPGGANTVNPSGGTTPLRIYSTDAPLPVQLTSFVGNFVGNNVLLEWSTVSEVNNYGFNVQRLNTSTNEFETIGFVAGKGTTLEPQYYSFLDENPGTTYRLEQIDNDGLVNYFGPIMLNPNSAPDNATPTVFALYQNYPNPFNPSTKIKYSLPTSGFTTLKVYNLLGTEVATLVNGYIQAGSHEVTFDASELSSGVYFYKLHSGNNIEVKKLTVMK